jgi:hypothetical protein
VSDPLVWEIHRRAGTAGDLHGLNLLGVTADGPDPADPTASSPVARGVWVLEPTAPAVVLGSAQRFTHGAVAVGGAAGHATAVDGSTSCAAEVVVRRSGGGAVALGPGVSLWVDVVLPRHDPLWDDDVSRSTQWLGRAWVAALESLGVEAAVHAGPTDRDAMSRAALPEWVQEKWLVAAASWWESRSAGPGPEPDFSAWPTPGLLQPMRWWPW